VSSSRRQEDLDAARSILQRSQAAPTLLRERGHRVSGPGGSAAGGPTLIDPGGVTVRRGAGPMPGQLTVRAAAVIARSCVEEWVEESLGRDRIDAGTASMRTKLCLAEVLGSDPGRSRTAATLWAALSEACHQHAFEYPPNPTELAALIEQVEILSQA